MISKVNVIGGLMVGGQTLVHLAMSVMTLVCLENIMGLRIRISFQKIITQPNVAGVGEVELKFIHDKRLVLKEVLRTPQIRKNLVFEYLLYKAGFTQTIRLDLFTLTKNNVFVEKSYAIDGMFKLNLEINKNLSSAYMLSNFNV